MIEETRRARRERERRRDMIGVVKVVRGRKERRGSFVCVVKGRWRRRREGGKEVGKGGKR